MKKFVIVCGAVAALSACSPAQTAMWLDWHAADPEAATEWVREECGELCTNDTNNNGIVEPDQSSSSGSSSSESSPSSSGSSNSSGSSVWDAIAECESGGNWSISTGNGYYGGLQFALQSWRAAGGSGYPHHASRSTQIAIAENLLDMQGWGAWPTCSRRLGLR